MRRQFTKTISNILEEDRKTVLLLGDIGVFGFKKAFEDYPNRVYNIGILEQGTVGLAAGLALEGFIPIFHTINSFLVERAFEQLKIDFGYQRLSGNFVSAGASYDFSKMGSTHHCPGDVALISTIPGMDIYVPGHPEEFDKIFRRTYNKPGPRYFRLSEQTNKEPHENGEDVNCNLGTDACVVAIGPMLDRVVEACRPLNVSITYYNSLKSIPSLCSKNPIFFIEPFYQGTCAGLVHEQLGPVHSIGVPRKFLTDYGTIEDFDRQCGLTVEGIRERIVKCL